MISPHNQDNRIQRGKSQAYYTKPSKKSLRKDISKVDILNPVHAGATVPCIETEKLEGNTIHKEHHFTASYSFLPFLTFKQTEKETGHDR